MVYNRPMHNSLVKNFFTPEEVDQLNLVFENSLKLRGFENNEDCTYVNPNDIVEQRHLGRIVMKIPENLDPYSSIHIPDSIFKKIDSYVSEVSAYDKPLHRAGATLVQYDPKYGVPELFPHVDLGCCAMIADYQLSSNTSWPIGIGKKIFDIVDNSMLVIDTLRQYHWRPIKTFSEEEYVRVIFFEYFNDDYGSISDEEKREEANVARDSYARITGDMD